MCAIDDADPADVWSETTRRAAKPHTCEECSRCIQIGEQHLYVSCLYDGHWSTFRTCAHCAAAGVWMRTVCGGYLTGGLLEELQEHWDEGYRSVGFGRLIIGARHRWHDGRDPVPAAVEVQALAERMLTQVVAA